MSSEFVEKAKSLTQGGPLHFAGIVIADPEGGSLRLRLARGDEVFDLDFSGVRECSIAASGRFVVNSLETYTDHPYLWNYRGWSTIFGKAPLPDAPKFFYDFHQLVLDILSVERNPLDYLYFEKGIAQWREFVYSRAYTLLNAPNEIAEATCDLLERQAAEYTILPDPERKGEEVNLALFEAKGLGKIVFERAQLC